jgi:fibro-slime domain-containing protein
VKLRTRGKIFAILLGAAAMTAGTNLAHATSLTAQWFTVSLSDPDFFGGTTGAPVNCSTDCYNGPYGVISNYVTSSLGPDGLPVYNTGATLGGQPGASGVDIHNTQLTWWSPAFNANVSAAGTSLLTLPISDTSVFPPQGGGSSDTPTFQTAILSGTLNVAATGTVTFNLGSDDDTFLYVDGTLVIDLGGIHSDAATNFSTTLSAGNHSLLLFYADRNRDQAQLTFSVVTPGVGLEGDTPLPAALPLFVSGLGALGGAAFWRKRKAKAAA